MLQFLLIWLMLLKSGGFRRYFHKRLPGRSGGELRDKMQGRRLGSRLAPSVRCWYAPSGRRSRPRVDRSTPRDCWNVQMGAHTDQMNALTSPAGIPQMCFFLLPGAHWYFVLICLQSGKCLTSQAVSQTKHRCPHEYEDVSTQSDNYHDQQLVTDEHVPCRIAPSEVRRCDCSRHDNCHFGLTHPRTLSISQTQWWTRNKRPVRLELVFLHSTSFPFWKRTRKLQNEQRCKTALVQRNTLLW